MCGRYAVTLPPEAMRQLFLFDGLPNLGPRWNVAPTQDVPVIRRGAGDHRRVLVMLRWGLVPRFARALTGPPLINARIETLLEKPTFRDAAIKRRCLVPMDHYYEWTSAPGSKIKQPWAIARVDGQPMAAAGIAETWTGPDGARVESVAIITRAAAPEIAMIHDRMPAEVGIEDLDPWLDPACPAVEALARIAGPSAPRAARKVSRRLNHVRAEGADLMTPDETPESPETPETPA